MKQMTRLTLAAASLFSAMALSVAGSSLAQVHGTPPGNATKATAASPATKPVDTAKVSVVLVHGAFADGSSWNKIIPKLQAKGLVVVAVQNPLTSLADDVAATQRIINAQPGPVVLVGHSWGGTVITQAGTNDKVRALVYVAAFAPSEGQSSAELGKDYPTPPGIGKLAPYADGFVYLPKEAVASDFAQDLPAAETNLIAVTQGPIRGANFDEKVTAAAWHAKPSWYVVATQDHMIDPKLQRALATKLHATVKELPTSHVPMVSRPNDVAEVIVAAAHKIAP